MKTSTVHITMGYLLIGCLLFGQIGAGLFHTRHEEHKTHLTVDDPVSLVNHGEHCKVCAINIFNQCFDVAVNNFSVTQGYLIFSSTDGLLISLAGWSLSQGRAPPVFTL